MDNLYCPHWLVALWAVMVQITEALLLPVQDHYTVIWCYTLEVELGTILGLR